MNVTLFCRHPQFPRLRRLRPPDGAQVRSGMLYRSGQHVGAPMPTWTRCAALDIRTVIDLRGITRARNESVPPRRGLGRRGDRSTTARPPPARRTWISVPRSPPQHYARERMLAVYTPNAAQPGDASDVRAISPRACRARRGEPGALLRWQGPNGHRRDAAAAYSRRVARRIRWPNSCCTNAAPTLRVLRAQSVPGHRAAARPQARRGGDPRAARGARGLSRRAFARRSREMHGSLDGWLENAR